MLFIFHFLYDLFFRFRNRSKLFIHFVSFPLKKFSECVYLGCILFLRILSKLLFLWNFMFWIIFKILFIFTFLFSVKFFIFRSILFFKLAKVCYFYSISFFRLFLFFIYFSPFFSIFLHFTMTGFLKERTKVNFFKMFLLLFNFLFEDILHVYLFFLYFFGFRNIYKFLHFFL